MKKFFTLTLALLASFSLWAGVNVFTAVSQEIVDGNWTIVGSSSDASQQSSVVFPDPAAEDGFPTGSQSKTNYYCKLSSTKDLGAKLASTKCVTIEGLSVGDSIVIYWFATSTTGGKFTLSYATGASNGAEIVSVNTGTIVTKNVYATSFRAMTETDIDHIENGYAESAGLLYLSANGPSPYIYAVKIISGTSAVTHTLEWDFAGGSCSATAGEDYTAGGQVAEGATITYPANNTMSKDGYDFNGWSTSATTMPTSDLTITAQWVEHTTSIDATLCAFSIDGYSFNETFNPENTDYTVTLPFYASAPAVSAVHATKNNAYASVGDVTYDGTKKEYSVTVTAENTVYTKTYTITLNWAATPTASSSINIEQLVLDNSKSYDIGSALDAANIAYVDKDALDSLLMGTKDKTKDDCNEAYLGLKFKKATSKVTIIVPSGQSLNVKFGAITDGSNLTVSVNGATPAAPSLTNNVYTLSASEGAKEVVFALGADSKTVVFKQIMVNEDIVVVRPFKITKNPTENGTFSIDLEKYAKSEEVTVNCVPETGYQLSTITVIGYTSKGAEQEVEVTGNKFTMPGSPVNITVTFSVATALDNTDVNAKAVKSLKNGVLFIEKNGKVYNAQGNVVK